MTCDTVTGKAPRPMTHDELAAMDRAALVRYIEWLQAPKPDCAHAVTYPTHICAECRTELGWCHVCGRAPYVHTEAERAQCERAL